MDAFRHVSPVSLDSPPHHVRWLGALAGWILALLTSQPQLAGAADDEQKAPLPPVLMLDTGRENLMWRKDQPIDYTHTSIVLDIPDFSQPLLTGIVTHTGRVVGLPISEVVLDCDGPQVVAMTVNGSSARWEQAKKHLVIPLAKVLVAGEAVTIIAKYTLDFTDQNGDGLTWSGPVDEPKNQTDATPMVHAQGQAEMNSRWFPCFDSPQERVTSEVIVTVDAGLEVLSNGTMLGRTVDTRGSAGQARTRWHWSLDREHAPYLITLAIGKFAVVDINDQANSARPGLAMPVYVPVGREADAQAIFANTPAMVSYFEQLFGEPFAWPQYAQAVVRGFRWGGMENSGATILTSGTIDKKPGEADGLISHELAHQWTGDLMTCRHWDHTWLNEGWATYAEALWFEHAKLEGIDSPGTYEDEVRGWLRGQIKATREMVWDPKTPEPAMGSARWHHPDDAFFGRDNAYSKGAFVLHMLRQELGDETFFRGVKDYVQKFRGKAVETQDFRFVMEAVYGRDLERFFDQWVSRAGLPFVTVRASWDTSASAVVITMTQTQGIDANKPAYDLRVPVVLTDEAGATRIVEMDFDTREATKAFPMAAMPLRMDVDPACAVLASFSPRAMDLRSGAILVDVIETEPPDAEPAPEPMPEPMEEQAEQPVGAANLQPND